MAELTAAETTADPCCAPQQQATCCEPSAKPTAAATTRAADAPPATTTQTNQDFACCGIRCGPHEIHHDEHRHIGYGITHPARRSVACRYEFARPSAARSPNSRQDSLAADPSRQDAFVVEHWVDDDGGRRRDRLCPGRWIGRVARLRPRLVVA
jgi:hypothetical protein